MSLVFYWHPTSSASPVASALAELEVPHERVLIDIRGGEQRTPEYLAINPNGQVPCLVVDGTPMFEGLAILLWLGGRYGVDRGLWPSYGTSEQLQALSWSSWAYVSYGATINRAWLATMDGPLRDPDQAAAALASADAMLGVLDRHLAGRAWALGEAYSLVDLILARVIVYGTYVGAKVDPHPHVQAWLQKVMARPAMQIEV